jgi:hypothetical protein
MRKLLESKKVKKKAIINRLLRLTSFFVIIAANKITEIQTRGLRRKSNNFDRKKNILSANMTKLLNFLMGMIFET